MIENEKTRRKILIIADTHDTSNQIQQLLHDSEYEVVLDLNVGTTNNTIKHFKADLVLLDLVSQQWDVSKVCHEIKSYTLTSGNYIPVIALSDVDHLENFPVGTEDGVDDFILRPVKEQELLARIRGLLRIQGLQDNLREAHDRLARAHRIIEKEISIVGQIQRSFLPRKFPSHPNIRIAAHYQPSMQAGGDYYDILPIDDNHWGIVMADIAGHGVSAAVVMALTQMAVKEFSANILSPQKALNVFNDKLNDHLSSDHFVTMFYAVLDLTTLELTYASAGHHPILMYDAKENRVAFMKTDPGFPLRTFNTGGYREFTATLSRGDQLLLYTDGVTDVLNPEREFYGAQRLIEIFERNVRTSPEVITQTIYQDTEIFRAGSDRMDDFTLMLIRVE